MLYEPEYLIRVKKAVRRLEERCLGMETFLSAALPRHLRTQPPPQQAEHLADQLLFAMAKTCAEPELLEREGAVTALWLEKLILYLLTQCAEQDQTFRELRRLVTISPLTRQILFEKHPSIYCEALAHNPPELFETYEAAVVHLLNRTGQLEPARELCQKLESLANP